MAFVDVVEHSRGRFPIPEVQPQPVLAQQPIGPPQHPPVFPIPAFCPRCYSQFNANFAMGGLCPHCNYMLPQLTMSTLTRPVMHVPLTQPPETRREDRFLMTDMLHVIDDVLKEQEDSDSLTSVTPVSSMTSTPSPVVPLYEPLRVSCCPNNQPVVFCSICQLLLCSVCVSTHDKDHPTSPFLTPPINPPLPSTEPLPVINEDSLKPCPSHPDQKSALFCLTCVATMCQTCALTEHTGHSVMSVNEAYVRYRPSIDPLLSKSQVEINLLDLYLAGAEKMCDSVTEREEEVIRSVRQVFKEHRAVLDKREQEVISQIQSIRALRVSGLTKEISTVQDHLSLLKTMSSQAETARKDSDHAAVLVAHFKLSDSLQKYRSTNQNPSEDDSFVIKPNPTMAEEALKNLCMVTTAPHPPLCTAMGEGLYHPRVHRLCTVTLCTKDRSGQSCLEGGERLFVQLKSGGNTLSVDVRDNSDGSYSINFRPRLKGEHQLVIAIRGQHIQGSPFTLLVDGGREYGRFGVVTHVFGSEGDQNGQFSRPWGICSDHHGNLIVGDRSNHRVQVFDSNGVFKYYFGSEGSRPGQFNRPAGVAVTREGNVVVADKDNHRIQVLKPDGSFLFMFGSKGGNDGQMIYPYDVAVNQADGRIAVTDTGNHRLLIFNHDGVLLGKFGYKGYLCGHFDSPRGIAFNDDGHIIVSDFNVHHILVIHPDGTTARILGSQGNGNGQFMRPQGIAVDHMGNYIVADTRNNRIAIMHPTGHFIAKFGTAGQGPGQFDRPTSIAVMPDGRIAVVDFGNSRVQIF